MCPRSPLDSRRPTCDRPKRYIYISYGILASRRERAGVLFTVPVSETPLELRLAKGEKTHYFWRKETLLEKRDAVRREREHETEVARVCLLTSIVPRLEFRSRDSYLRYVSSPRFGRIVSFTRTRARASRRAFQNTLDLVLATDTSLHYSPKPTRIPNTLDARVRLVGRAGSVVRDDDDLPPTTGRDLHFVLSSELSRFKSDSDDG